jgi:hypothetical protein
MATIKGNVMMVGISGKLGDIVFRQAGGNTIVSRRPVMKMPPTERQLAQRLRFEDAARFASIAIENPKTFLSYQQMAKRQHRSSAYQAALTDHLTQPEIGSVLATYNGHIGDVISIKGKVRYKITGITASIFAADGSMIESGEARVNGTAWRYTVAVANKDVTGCKVRSV